MMENPPAIDQDSLDVIVGIAHFVSGAAVTYLKVEDFFRSLVVEEMAVAVSGLETGTHTGG